MATPSNPQNIPQQQHHLHAIVDIGSNGIRFSITPLLSPSPSPSPRNSTRPLIPLYTHRSPISLHDAQHVPGGARGISSRTPIPETTVEAVILALLDFKRTCEGHKVPDGNVVVVATEATRSASNSAEFVGAIEKETGWVVRLLSKDDEARFGALGVVASVPWGCRGLVGDLGGGSLQFSFVGGEGGGGGSGGCGDDDDDDGIGMGMEMDVGGDDVGKGVMAKGVEKEGGVGKGISLPYGAAEVMRRLGGGGGGGEQQDEDRREEVLLEEIQAQLQKALESVLVPGELLRQDATAGGAAAAAAAEGKPKPKTVLQVPLFLSGGGFRGWGYLLMAAAAASSVDDGPYPIQSINGFTVPWREFTNIQRVLDFVNNQTAISGSNNGSSSTGNPTPTPPITATRTKKHKNKNPNDKIKKPKIPSIHGVSARRLSQLPAIALVVRALSRALPRAVSKVKSNHLNTKSNPNPNPNLRNNPDSNPNSISTLFNPSDFTLGPVTFTTGGVPVGILYELLSGEVRAQSALTAAASMCASASISALHSPPPHSQLNHERDDAQRLRLLLMTCCPKTNDSSAPQTPKTINQIIPALCHLANVHAPLPAPDKAGCALRYPITGSVEICAALGVSHVQRAGLALALWTRWGGVAGGVEPDKRKGEKLGGGEDERLVRRLRMLVGARVAWWAEGMGRLCAIFVAAGLGEGRGLDVTSSSIVTDEKGGGGNTWHLKLRIQKHEHASRSHGLTRSEVEAEAEARRKVVREEDGGGAGDGTCSESEFDSEGGEVEDGKWSTRTSTATTAAAVNHELSKAVKALRKMGKKKHRVTTTTSGSASVSSSSSGNEGVGLEISNEGGKWYETFGMGVVVEFEGGKRGR